MQSLPVVEIIPIYILSPLGKDQGPAFEKTWIPFTPSRLCSVWLKLARWFWRRWLFKCYFLLFHYYLHFEEGMAFHLSKLNPLYPRMIYAKFGWNLPSSGEERFLIFINAFLLFPQLPLEKCWPRILYAKFSWNWLIISWENYHNDNDRWQTNQSIKLT